MTTSAPVHSKNLLSESQLVELETNTISAQPEKLWLNQIRHTSLQDFIAQSIPNRKSEHWKYNDMFFLEQAKLNHISNLDTSSDLPQSLTKITEQAILCVFIDGIYASKHSNIESNNDLTITLFSDANEQQSKLIQEHLTTSKQSRNLLIQLNAAASQDGVLIEVRASAKIEHPIYMLHFSSQLSEQQSEQQFSTNQTVFYCDVNSECEVIEHFVSNNSPSAQLSLQQTIFSLQENSQCTHYRLNMEGSDNRQVSRTLTLLEKHARVKGFYYSEGSLLNKTDIDVQHLGEHSESDLTGIYLPAGSCTIDYHTNIEHRVANCTSREVFRGIIADSSKATFNGKIHIFRDAQKSDAQLNNRNLLLTNQAEINTKPELEIYADDVVCAHGATIAKIDELAIYYLQTRGIDKMRAKKMLSIGFINELLEKIAHDPVSQYMQQQVQARLSNIK